MRVIVAGFLWETMAAALIDLVSAGILGIAHIRFDNQCLITGELTLCVVLAMAMRLWEISYRVALHALEESRCDVGL